VALEIFFAARRLIYSRLIQLPKGGRGMGEGGWCREMVRAREGGKINARDCNFRPAVVQQLGTPRATSNEKRINRLITTREREGGGGEGGREGRRVVRWRRGATEKEEARDSGHANPPVDVPKGIEKCGFNAVRVDEDPFSLSRWSFQ